MFRSNLLIYKRLFMSIVLALTVSLIGCLDANEQSPEERSKFVTQEGQTATFRVDTVKGFSTESGYQSKGWKLPETRFFSFKACLKSSGRDAKVVGQDFEIDADGVIYKRTTDQSGCLIWDENIPYPVYGDSKYVSFKKKITGIGVHTGTRTIELAVNPWGRQAGKSDVIYIKNRNADGSQSYVDPKQFIEGGASVQEALHNVTPESVPLFMKNVKINVVKQGQKNAHLAMDSPDNLVESEIGKLEGSGDRLEIQVEMDAFVSVKGEGGFPEDKKLRAGKFRVFVQVIATDFGENANQKLLLFNGFPHEVAEINSEGNKKLTVTIKTVQRMVTAEGILRLALKVVPIGGPQGLTEFEGLYMMGNYKSIRGSKGLIQENIKNFSYANYISDAANFERLKKNYFAFDAEQYIFDEMTVKPIQIEPGETSTTRTVAYRTSTCVRDLATGSKRKFLRFTVERIRDSSVLIQPKVKNKYLVRDTGDNGCLAWVDKVSHKYYNHERYLHPSVFIRRDNFKKRLELAINPWDLHYRFGFDTRSSESTEQRAKIDSRFFITGYSYQTLRFRYSIDRYMNLEVRKTVALRVDPEVLRYNSIVTGLQATEKLRDGIYLMKVALLNYYLDPTGKGVAVKWKGKIPDGKGKSGAFVVVDDKDENREVSKKKFLSTVTKLVRVQSGKIITPVTFKMRDLRLMRIRNQFLIQLETIDERKLQVLTRANRLLEHGGMRAPGEGLSEGYNSLIAKGKCLLVQRNLLKNERMRLLEGLSGESFEGESVALKEAKNIDRATAPQRNYPISEIKAQFGIDVPVNTISCLEQVEDFIEESKENFTLNGSVESLGQRAFGRSLDELDKEITRKIEQLGRSIWDEKTRISGILNRMVQDMSIRSSSQNKLFNPVDNLIEQSFLGTNLSEQDYSPLPDPDYFVTKDSVSKEEINGDQVIDSRQKMENLMTRYFVPAEEQLAFFKALDANDFTVNPAAPLVALNTLVDHDSGLKGRTFIGPMTLLLNGNSSNLRPVDTLDSKFCTVMDCSQGIDWDNLKFYSGGASSDSQFFLADHIMDMRELEKMHNMEGKFKDTSSYSGSKYFASLQGFKPGELNMDRLIDEKILLEAAYKKKMAGTSQLYEFVKRQGLTYVSLGRGNKEEYSNEVDPYDRVLKRYKGGGCVYSDTEDCLEKVEDFKNEMSSNEFLNRLRGVAPLSKSTPIHINPKYKKQIRSISLDDVHDLLSQGYSAFEDRLNLGVGMCLLVAKHNVQRVYGLDRIDKRIKNAEALGLSEDDVYFMEQNRSELAMSRHTTFVRLSEKCIGQIKSGRYKEAFAFDVKLRVFETGEYRYRGGKNMNLNVNGGYTLNHNEASGAGLSLSASFGYLPGLPFIKSIPFIGVIGDIGSRVMRMSWDSSRARSDQKSMQEQTYLVMQTAALDIEIKKHEKCLALDFKQDNRYDMGIHGIVMAKLRLRAKDPNPDSGLHDREEDLSTGFLICSGVEERRPTAVRERYYYFTQHFTEGDMLDAGDIYNQPWLLMLRGARAFRAFIASVKRFQDVRLTDYGMLALWDREAGKVLKNGEEAWPLKALEDTYYNVTPSFPGIYSVLDETYERASYPWSGNAGCSFDRQLSVIGLGLYDMSYVKDEIAKVSLDPDPAVDARLRKELKQWKACHQKVDPRTKDGR